MAKTVSGISGMGKKSSESPECFPEWPKFKTMTYDLFAMCQKLSEMPEIVLKYAKNFRKIGGNHFSNLETMG